MEKRYADKRCESEHEKLCYLEEAVNNGNLTLLLQTFAENVDLSAPLPSSVSRKKKEYVYFSHYFFIRQSERLRCTEL